MRYSQPLGLRAAAALGFAFRECVVREAVDRIPRPGLFVTQRALPGQEELLPAQRLVQLRTEPDFSQVVLALPKVNRNRRWSFRESGIVVTDLRFLASLEARPAEGYYILSQPLHVTADTILPRRTLVQMTYSLTALPIVYVARFEGSSIVFPNAGYKFSAELLPLLQDAGFLAPAAQDERQLH